MVPIFIIKAGHMNTRKKSTLNIHSGDINDGGGIENLQGIIINFYLIKFPGSSTYTCICIKMNDPISTVGLSSQISFTDSQNFLTAYSQNLINLGLIKEQASVYYNFFLQFFKPRQSSKLPKNLTVMQSLCDLSLHKHGVTFI